MRRLLLVLVLTACGSEPPPPPSTSVEAPPPSTPPPQGELRHLDVQVVAWSVTGEESGPIHDAAQQLAISDCPIHDSGARQVRLHGRVGENGVLAWQGDDAGEAILGTCLWIPFFREGHLGPGDFDVRVALADAAAPLPAATDPAPPNDWTGLVCHHSVPAHCPPGHTCPASIWEEQPCPVP